MNNKAITWGLAVLVAFLLISFFVAQNLFLDRENRIEELLSTIIISVKDDNWEQAEQSDMLLNEIWERGKYLIALNNAEYDFSDMSDTVENLKGAIEARSSRDAIQLVRQIEGHLKNFKRFVPEP